MTTRPDPGTPETAKKAPDGTHSGLNTPSGHRETPRGENGPQTGAESFRVLVTGSRAWLAPETVWAALNDVRDETLLTDRHLTVVHGACPHGADAHAAHWCATATQFVNGITEETHPANWRPAGTLDRSAGPRRNARMVNLGADLCLAFIRNGSPGATHTAALAEAAGIPVRRWTA